MPATYEPIATTTLGSAQSSVSFTSIPQTYTDLVLVSQNKTSATVSVRVDMTFNSDTSTNYSCTRVYGNGSTTTSDRFSSASALDVGFMPGTDGTGYGMIVLNIMNYSNTTTYKTVLDRWSSQEGGSIHKYVVAEVGLWRSTSAITSITFVTNGSFNFASGSTFTLYGIKAA